MQCYLLPCFRNLYCPVVLILSFIVLITIIVGTDFSIDFSTDFNGDFSGDFNADFDADFLCVPYLLRFKLITKYRSSALNERPTSLECRGVNRN